MCGGHRVCRLGQKPGIQGDGGKAAAVGAIDIGLAAALCRAVVVGMFF